MKALIGEKIGMTQVFSKEGNCVPVTVLQVDKCVPILRRTQEENGYDAVLVAYGTRKSKHTNKPGQGFYDKVKAAPARILAEFRDQDIVDEELGKPLTVDLFSEGDKVSVVGVSKGKGFAGVMKRWVWEERLHLMVIMKFIEVVVPSACILIQDGCLEGRRCRGIWDRKRYLLRI